MYIDYKNLKKHCNIEYSIKSKSIKIGKLSDNQLEISARILKNKQDKTVNEVNQLKSIEYVMNYRSEKAIDKLQQDIKVRRLTRADTIAANLTNVITKTFK